MELRLTWKSYHAGLELTDPPPLAFQGIKGVLCHNKFSCCVTRFLSQNPHSVPMRGLWRSAWPHLLEVPYSAIQCGYYWKDDLKVQWFWLPRKECWTNNQSFISEFLKWMEPNCYCRLINLRWDTDSVWGRNKTPRSSLHFALKSPFASDTERELQSPLGAMTCLLLGHQDTGPPRIKYLATAPTCPSLTVLHRKIKAGDLLLTLFILLSPSPTLSLTK